MSFGKTTEYALRIYGFLKSYKQHYISLDAVSGLFNIPLFHIGSILVVIVRYRQIVSAIVDDGRYSKMCGIAFLSDFFSTVVYSPLTGAFYFETENKAMAQKSTYTIRL